ncbi:MAG TPA: methyltransferase domain-containing protein [Kofleriaceae bacterium]|jgi:SAM-dependent methyltransferase
MAWRDHPLCGPRATYPDRFWGPERMDSDAFVELVDLLSPDAELAAITAALAGVTDVVDIGGGTGLITQAIARIAPVRVIEPDPEQRAHLPPGITVQDGRAEHLPVADRGTDAAVITWVMQYCDDPLKAISELVRIARRRVVIVQAAPTNDLVTIYNTEAAIAGDKPAHHGWLLATAAEALEAAGFTVELHPLAIPLKAPKSAAALADTLARMHFRGHAKIREMIDATLPLIEQRLASGALSDDGAMLVARR